MTELTHCYGESVHVFNEADDHTRMARLGQSPIGTAEAIRLVAELYSGLCLRVIRREMPILRGEWESRMVNTLPDDRRDCARWRGVTINDAASASVISIMRAGEVPAQVCFLKLLEFTQRVEKHHLWMERTTDDTGRVTGARIDADKIRGRYVNRSVVFIPDPMGATGATMIEAVRTYREVTVGTPSRLLALHLIVTPEYLRAVRDVLPELVVYAMRLDRGLSKPDVLALTPGERWEEECGITDKCYIVPGLGDVGKLLCGML